MIEHTSNSAHRYVALDSLRGICACMVVLHHIPSQSTFLMSEFVKHSFLFVDFFFVLSGFVIGSSYGNRLTEGFGIMKFMFLRFFRIYPLHLAMMLVFLAFEISILVFSPDTLSRKPFQNAYSVESWFCSVGLVHIFFGPDGTPWNGPSWSIAAEFWTYLIFAIGIKAFPKSIAAVSALIVIIAPIIISMLTDRYMYLFHDGALLRCLFGFAVGILSWKVPLRFREFSAPQWVNNLLEFSSIATVVVYVSWAGSGSGSLIAPMVFSIVVLIFARARGAASHVMRSSPMVLIGALSYSIYMIHAFLLYRFMNVLSVIEQRTGFDLVNTIEGKVLIAGDNVVTLLIILTFFSGVFVASWFSYKFVEVPGQNLGKRFSHVYDRKAVQRRIRAVN